MINNGLRNLARIATGLLFVFSGYVKAIDPIGSAIKFEEYFEAFGMHFFVPGALFFGVMLAVVELLTGLCFLFGLRIKQVSWLALLFMMFMTALTLVLAITNKVQDCGCFGDAIKLTNWQTFYKNLVILPVVAYIFAGRRRFKPAMHCVAEWFTAVILAAACTGLSIYNYKHLPFIDFMPYKVGVNLPEAMIKPEGSPDDIYETTLIYEKAGKQEKFTIDNIPDSTWTFVDSKSKLIKAGYVPPARDFALSLFDGDIDTLYVYEKDGVQQTLDYHIDNDTTQMLVDIIEETGHVQDRILSHSGYLFFLTSADVNEAKRNISDEINTICEYAGKNNMKFLFLSGSAREESLEYTAAIHGNFKMYFTDATVLKSMIRSNPGLMLLKDGVILRKWNCRDLPSVEELNQIVNSKPADIIKKYKAKEAAITWAMIAIAGFLLLCFSFKTIKKHERRRHN